MRGYYKIILLLLMIHAVLLAIFVTARIADYDEGFYSIAALMMHQGFQPYTDFFFMQMSMLPTLFAPFATGGWQSFFVLRIFAALAGILSALMLTVIVNKMTKDMKVTLIALFLYALNGLFVIWHTTFKALPFTHFLSLATFFFWLRYYEKRKISDLILTGLLLSALINFRSVFIVLLPLYLISIIVLSQNRKGRNLAVFLISLVPFAVPTLVRLYQSSASFIYGNLMFHLYRDIDRGFLSILGSKLDVFTKVIIDPQLLIILVLVLFSVIGLARSGMKLPRDLFGTPAGMALMNFVLIFVVYLLPHPMTRQYIEQYLGFAIIIIAMSLPALLKWFENHVRAVQRKRFIAAIAAVYILGIVPYFVIFIFGVRAHDNRYRLSEIKKVTTKMLALGGETDIVLSEWPGYLYLTRQVPLRYTEIYAHEYDLPLTHEEFLKYNLCDRIYLRDKIEDKSPALVVNVYETPDYYADLLDSNYALAFQSDVVSIYKRR
ncbi:MAG: glycosyltransferase family 39 protein [Candidatus Zixiibacteriota bacterium]